MSEVLETLTFTHEIEGPIQELIIPPEFVRDFHFYGKKHLTIMLRVTGPDQYKVSDFFEDAEEQIFHLKTVDSEKNEISDKYVLRSIYIDEGPPLSVDIDIEPPLVRAILDFEKK